MTQNFEDIENLLSQHNIILSADSNEIRVVKKRRLNNGFQQTVDIQRIKILKQQIANPIIYNPQNRVLNTVCLTIQDIKRAVAHESHWKVFNFSFRKVILYGIATVENQFTRNGDSMYTISIDDETGLIKGTYKEFDKNTTAQQKAMLTREVNQLKTRREVGVNLFGKFYASNSEDGQFVFNCVGNLQKMIDHNLKHQHKKFQQGPIQQKVLIYAKPFQFHDELRLYIIDLWECDHIELAWKRHLNRLYINQYLK